MSLAELTINEDAAQFEILNAADIAQNRRAKSYFEDVLGATFSVDGSLAIPFGHDGDDKNLVLGKIHKALEKFGISSGDSEGVQATLSKYYKNKKDFQVFSEKARAVWSNVIEPPELKTFTEILAARITNRHLYPRQVLAAFHLAFAQNACNFSVPGAGKTSMVYGAYAYLNSLPPSDPKFVNKLLVVGPLSSFGPWEDEYRECFGIPAFSKRLSGGVPRAERRGHLLSTTPVNKTPELTLMSYQSVASNLSELKYYLGRSGNRVMVVLDEAHRIKNVEGGIWASAVLQLADLSSARVVLTGTPVPNGYEDIYNLYEFIWPGKGIINYNIYQLKDMSTRRFDGRVERLVNDISPFFIRIKKSEILPPDKFPIVNHPPQLVKMGPVQREIYDLIENKYINYFVEHQSNQGATAELTKARFIRLMQAATNPALLSRPLDKYFEEHGFAPDLLIEDSGVINKILKYKDLEPVPAKFIAVGNLVQELLDSGERVVLWGTFIYSIKALQEHLQNLGISSQLLIGETPVEQEDTAADVLTREKIIREFHNPKSEFKVLIANPFAVAESISLHRASHHAVYFERTFNAANFIQSKDRIHRVGLPEGVETHYHYILAENSIDETIHQRLAEKERRMLELIESREIPLFNENMNFDIDMDSDIKAIIRDYVRRTTSA